jgi:hypothetical protein
MRSATTGKLYKIQHRPAPSSGGGDDAGGAGSNCTPGYSPCATTLFRRGPNAKLVQLWLGHSSPSFTIATYVHLLPDDLPQVDVFAAGGNQVGTRQAETSRDARPGAEAETA